MFTIFGYSGPKTDQEAIKAMQEAWGSKYDRNMEQTEFITHQSEKEINDAWERFIHSHHYEVHDDFCESWIAKHPRRTGEAYFSQYIDSQFINDNPIPKDAEFTALWDWFEKLRDAEDSDRKASPST
jgi:hypothetical protein